jgi:hypothetical protein
MYVYGYIYMHTHIHTNTHTNTHTHYPWAPWQRRRYRYRYRLRTRTSILLYATISIKNAHQYITVNYYITILLYSYITIFLYSYITILLYCYYTHAASYIDQERATACYYFTTTLPHDCITTLLHYYMSLRCIIHRSRTRTSTLLHYYITTCYITTYAHAA